MNIKGLLIGSAAAFASVSGAHAADAIIAAEPEAVEYVRVCDSFGAGFFYIPGSETCLKVGGYVRFQTDFKDNAAGTSSWNTFTRAQLNIDARTETELGALRSLISFRGQPSTAGDQRGVWVEEAFIELGGFRAGKFYSWWDDGLSGETDELANYSLFNSARYVYDAGNFSFGVSVDELESTGDFAKYTGAAAFAAGTTALPGAVADYKTWNNNNIGIAANLGVKFDGVTFDLLGGYDTDRGEGAIRGILTAKLGPGTLGLSSVYATGANAYFAAAEWVIAAEYAVAVTDRFKLTPGVQYYSNVNVDSVVGTVASNTNYTVTNKWSTNDAWKAGLTADYKITSGLDLKTTVNYYDEDTKSGAWTGFVRLNRSF